DSEEGYTRPSIETRNSLSILPPATSLIHRKLLFHNRLPENSLHLSHARGARDIPKRVATGEMLAGPGPTATGYRAIRSEVGCDRGGRRRASDDRREGVADSPACRKADRECGCVSGLGQLRAVEEPTPCHEGADGGAPGPTSTDRHRRSVDSWPFEGSG